MISRLKLKNFKCFSENKIHLHKSGFWFSGVTSGFESWKESWMSAILGDLQLNYHTDYNKAITELWIKNSLVDTGIVPTLTGIGISYVRTIVVAGLWASTEPGNLLVIENPEAHLHPYAQSNMGKFLALLAFCGVQVRKHVNH